MDSEKSKDQRRQLNPLSLLQAEELHRGEEDIKYGDHPTTITTMRIKTHAHTLHPTPAAFPCHMGLS